MKLLLLSQGYTVEDQLGYHDATIAARTAGIISEYQNIPYLGYAREHGWEELWREVVSRCRREAFDVVFFQFYHGSVKHPGTCLASLKSLPRPPLVAASCGDAHTGLLWRRPPERPFVELAVRADVTFLTSMGSFAEYLAKRGARRLMLMPHAFSEVVFRWPDEERLTATRDFDVVLVGSCPHTRNLMKPWLLRYERRRRRVIERLTKRYGKKFGLFGHGWKGYRSWQGPIRFLDQQSAFWRGSLVVDAAAPFDETYYASDRPFYIAGSGVPLVQHYTPRFEKIFAADRHAHFVYNDADIAGVCDRVLDMDAAVRLRMARETVRLVQERHLNRHRMRDMLMTCARIREAGKNSRTEDWIARVPMGYFLPEVDHAAERPHAMVNW